MGKRRTTLTLLAVTAVASVSQPAWAGMPAPLTLVEAAQARLTTISFCLMVLLASAGIVRWLWNGATTTFTRLPRLSYAKALGLVLLWGLLLAVVLMMIASARELMTPGAWDRDGVKYKLKQGGQ